jgi:prolyl-tRNA synthetase
MGGNISHEFQMISDVGEDTIYICPKCGWGANKDVAKESDPCPECGCAMETKRGVEIGNIFQLGDKYTKSMKLEFAGRNNEPQNPIMGCYGIGVSRAMGALLEESADENGPVWSMATAPFAVHVISLGGDETANKSALKIYDDLVAAGVETILDDRDARAGEKFADADLIAAPIRVIISPKTLEKGSAELKYRINDRDTAELPENIELKGATKAIMDLIKKLS